MPIADRLLPILHSRPLVALAERTVRRGARCQGPSAAPAVALTFDDGPDPRWTPRLLDALADHHARATFFCVGRHARAHSSLVRRAAEEGHEIATHLESHARETVFDDASFERELESSLDLLESLSGRRPRHLRFPYGEPGAQSPRALSARGVTSVYWTTSVLDSRRADPDAIAERALVGARPGAIILLHDAIGDLDPPKPPYLPTRDATVRALPTILRGLTDRGLACVTLDELFLTEAAREARSVAARSTS